LDPTSSWLLSRLTSLYQPTNHDEEGGNVGVEEGAPGEQFLSDSCVVVMKWRLESVAEEQTGVEASGRCEMLFYRAISVVVVGGWLGGGPINLVLFLFGDCSGANESCWS
jgi:hypothetical protein